MKERDRAKNDLEVKWMDAELYLTNRMWNYPLVADDTTEKWELNPLQPGLVYL